MNFKISRRKLSGSSSVKEYTTLQTSSFIHFFKQTFIILFSFAVILITNVTDAQTNQIDEKWLSGGSYDPISVVAHGAILDNHLKPIEPTKDFLLNTLNHYIKRLEGEAHEEVIAQLINQNQTLEKLKIDKMTRQLLTLEYLINTVNPRDKAYLEARNHAIRRAWYKNLYGMERYLKEVDQGKKFPFSIVKLGQDIGMISKATDAAGSEYINECMKAQVPIPPTWGSSSWLHVGDLTTNFLGFGNPTEVWRANSSSPKGLCVALPRIAGSSINALGIICLGTESSNACFFDAQDVPLGKEMSIENFQSGADLFNGVCTDCHAGENPYIVHPGSPLDMWPDNKAQTWYKPLIKPSWPQNPGPFGLLAQVPINPLPPDEDGDCSSCHNQLEFGRFPDLLALNTWKGGESDYCRVILKSAIGNTMPDLGSNYNKHAQAMLTFCGQSTPSGGEVPRPDTGDDPSVISPPLIIGPLYACAEAIEVRGGIYGAKLSIYIDGAPTASITITTPSRTIVNIPPLLAGQVIGAVQEMNGVNSNPSNSVTVIDHSVAYPSGLPIPNIDPKVIYECGHTIAVRHVRGAKVTVFTNNSDDISYMTGGDWTNLPPKTVPFVLNDSFTAQQSFCTDTSKISAPETVSKAPSPMPAPLMNPTPPIVGQQLVDLANLANGAITTLYESSIGNLGGFSTAIDWYSEFDIATGLGGPLKPGQQLSVVSSLCEDIKVSIPEPQSCKALGAPRIGIPLVGQTFVTVTDAVPGARILVYDSALNEIGDGSGIQVGLTRPIVAGDVLTVIQMVGDCTSDKAYQTGVICASKEVCG